MGSWWARCSAGGGTAPTLHAIVACPVPGRSPNPPRVPGPAVRRMGGPGRARSRPSRCGGTRRPGGRGHGRPARRRSSMRSTPPPLGERAARSNRSAAVPQGEGTAREQPAGRGDAGRRRQPHRPRRETGPATHPRGNGSSRSWRSPAGDDRAAGKGVCVRDLVGFPMARLAEATDPLGLQRHRSQASRAAAGAVRSLVSYGPARQLRRWPRRGPRCGRAVRTGGGAVRCRGDG